MEGLKPIYMECPGNDLEILISNVYSFDHYDVFARMEPSMKEMRITVREMFPYLDRSRRKKITETSFKKFLKEYKTNQRISYILGKYGETKGKVIRNVRGHLKSCEKCREKYAEHLDEQAEKWLRWAQDKDVLDGKEKAKAQEVIEKGYLNLLKEADIFGFFNQLTML